MNWDKIQLSLIKLRERGTTKGKLEKMALVVGEEQEMTGET